MDIILMSVVAFFVAAIPYSVLIGRFVFNVDIRQFGDGNPGATNVYRATKSKIWYVVAVMADALKGTIPVGIAFWSLGWMDTRIVPVAIAAIAGHAFSPFLNFNGGKAVAVTGGVWAALTLWEVPIVLGLSLLAWVRVFKESDWVVMATMFTVLAWLVFFRAYQPYLLGVWLGNLLILAYKHRAGLTALPTLKHRD
jgi:glycerol-3-phosphate acyltransferase PlsY